MSTVVVSEDPSGTAQAAAARLAHEINVAIAARGIARVAVSGGSTPTAMFGALRTLVVDWPNVQIFQVDERVAPDRHPDRNLTSLRTALLDHVPAVAHPLEVNPPRLDAPVLPDRFDVVHLGLGDDGHTASLVPGDPVLDERERPLALTQSYQGRARVTFTYPVIEAARLVLWLACGPAKRDMVARARQHDHEIPAGRVVNANQVWFVDRAADPSPQT